MKAFFKSKTIEQAYEALRQYVISIGDVLLVTNLDHGMSNWGCFWVVVRPNKGRHEHTCWTCKKAIPEGCVITALYTLNRYGWVKNNAISTKHMEYCFKLDRTLCIDCRLHYHSKELRNLVIKDCSEEDFCYAWHLTKGII